MSQDFHATLTGIFPRSEELVEATRGLDRGRVTPAHCEAVRVEDTRKVIDLQRAAGFAFHTDGQLGWQDLFRPLVDRTRGLEAGALTRWFDNNTFYRRPVVRGDLVLKGGLGPGAFRTRLDESARWKVVLPGPYTFARAAEGQGEAGLRAGRVEAFGDLLRGAARWCAERGARRFQFSEPWLVYGQPSRADLAAAEAAYETITKGLRAETLVFPYFGDLKRVFPAILDFPVDAVGVDLTATDLDALEEHAFDKGLVLGAVDGRNSLVETPQDIVSHAREALDRLDPDWVAVAPSCEMELLPRPVAEAKVRALGAAVALGRDTL
ncbi:MAG TPA: hypothetical protein VGB42_02860 [Candidatus Thermoplasmatota archaeon]